MITKFHTFAKKYADGSRSYNAEIQVALTHDNMRLCYSNGFFLALMDCRTGNTPDGKFTYNYRLDGGATSDYPKVYEAVPKAEKNGWSIDISDSCSDAGMKVRKLFETMKPGKRTVFNPETCDVSHDGPRADGLWINASVMKDFLALTKDCIRLAYMGHEDDCHEFIANTRCFAVRFFICGMKQ